MIPLSLLKKKVLKKIPAHVYYSVGIKFFIAAGLYVSGGGRMLNVHYSCADLFRSVFPFTAMIKQMRHLFLGIYLVPPAAGHHVKVLWLIISFGWTCSVHVWHKLTCHGFQHQINSSRLFRLNIVGSCRRQGIRMVVRRWLREPQGSPTEHLLWRWCQDDELPEESHQFCLVFVFISFSFLCRMIASRFFVWLLISGSILVEKV